MKKSDVHTLDRVSSLMSVDNSPSPLGPAKAAGPRPVTNQTGLEKYFPADFLARLRSV